jgi:hypothetical protein
MGVTVSRPGGRGASRQGVTPPAGTNRGRSGLHRAGCWLTASRGDLQESATENRPPMAPPPGGAQVRVKRCGKSAPATGVTRPARQTPPGARSNRGTDGPSGVPSGTPPPGGPLRWMATQPSNRGWTESRLQADSPSTLRCSGERRITAGSAGWSGSSRTTWRSGCGERRERAWPRNDLSSGAGASRERGDATPSEHPPLGRVRRPSVAVPGLSGPVPALFALGHQAIMALALPVRFQYAANMKRGCTTGLT